MANTLTNLIPTLYNALDVVSRELVGFVPAVTLDATFERAAVGQVVRSFVTPAASAGDIAPAVTPPNDGDQTIGNVSMEITKARRVPIRWNGEETRGLNNNGPGQNPILVAQFAQAMRTLVNEVEADVAATYVAGSRAHGTAGTAPFGSTPSIGDSAAVLKILKDNGAPGSDLHIVCSTAAGANLRSLANLYKVNEAGDRSLLRQGVLGDLHGFMIRESAQVKSHTKGTGASYAVDASGGLAVGATVIPVKTGTGTIVAGDIITFAADTVNKYVVATTLANGSLTIAAPGLRVAIPDSNAITVGANYSANMAFSRNAIALATRAPALPNGGDMADDRTVVVDPFSGMAFEVSLYRQYRQIQYEVAMAWGVKLVKPEHTALLLG